MNARRSGNCPRRKCRTSQPSLSNRQTHTCLGDHLIEHTRRKRRTDVSLAWAHVRIEGCGTSYPRHTRVLP